MKEAAHLTERQFEPVYRHGRTWASPYLILKASPNGLEGNRLGFAVGKRLGKAVVRNRVKRRLREIARATALKPGWDLVLVSRQEARDVDFPTLARAVADLLGRARLLAEAPSPAVVP